MKMNWYYRTILSYAPILFVIISSMIFIIFLVLNNASEKKYKETNNAILNRMVFNLDANLMLIERNIVSKLLMDNDIQEYFSDRPKHAVDDFMLQKKIIELSLALPFSNTIYMYNENEQRIISDLGSYALDSFGDREFLMFNYDKKESTDWHDPRLFAYAAFDEDKQKVVSLVKFAYTGDEVRGAFVVNVYQRSFMDYLNSLNESDSNLVLLLEGDDNAPQALDSGADMIMVQSDYTGWRFVSQGVYDSGYNILSLFSSVWMFILIFIILLALVGFTIVTHMHYKPIHSIMEKVGQFSNRKSEELGIKGANNEFTFIEMALDHLLKRSLDYENLHKEDCLLRQQRLFRDLLAGHLYLTDEEFKQKLADLSLPDAYDRLGVIVVEIDHYSGFTDKYKVKDQHLLKFIIESAFRDLGQNHHSFVWDVWMEPHRIAFVIQHIAADPRSSKTTSAYAEEFQKWINQHLELTITIGVGADSDSIETVADSYRNAHDNVELKMIFGTNTIIDNRKSAGKLSLDNYVYLQALDQAVQSFRMNESDWREKLTQIFTELRKMRFMKQDMTGLVNIFAKRMDQAVKALSANIQQIWKQDFQHRFAHLNETAETLDEFEYQFMGIMAMFEACVDEDRQARRHHSIAMQAKGYIDAHFADPDLSLARVSDIFKLQPSALSLLFKEELGEKFVDYVLKIRMQQAKRLLIETEDSIQSIAEQIGYQNVNSFYRAFKKLQDVPPGEFRNMYRTI